MEEPSELPKENVPVVLPLVPLTQVPISKTLDKLGSEAKFMRPLALVRSVKTVAALGTALPK